MGMDTAERMASAKPSRLSLVSRAPMTVCPTACGRELTHLSAGETGSALTDPDDTSFYDTFSFYLNNTGIGNDGAHSAIPHIFWYVYPQ